MKSCGRPVVLTLLFVAAALTHHAQLGSPGCLYAAEHEAVCRYHVHGQEFSGRFGIELEGDGRRYAPDRVADILHIRLDVTPDFDRRTVSGTTHIDFQPIAQPLKELTLNAVDLTIAAVRSDCQVLDFVNTGQQLVITFAEPIPPRMKAYVEIDHAAEPKRGLYFRTPEMGYPATDTQIWTQGESHEARYWFPCFDYPNERSSSEIICHVPSDMVVLSNGRKLGEQAEEGGRKAVHWLQETPHVNYLICLVAGYFEKLEKQHRDVPLAFYVQPSLAEHAANSFADTDQIMAFYEQEIGIPFPWEKYDQVTVLDFIAGGMENTTLTTLTHNTIFSTATENLRTTRRLDAHELAHQWFGDFVTCKDWSHLWLNEGFATYYTHLYEGHKFGRDWMLYGLYEDAQGEILPQSRDGRGIVYNGYKNPAEQFDYRSYPKGSWILHMLRSQLGPDLYRMCIREYLQRHALQSVVSDDLRQVFESISGRSLDRFFDQWVYHGGAPELNIRYSWEPQSRLAKVTIKQVQPVGDKNLLFELPTILRFHVGQQVVNHAIVVDQPEQDFFVPLPGKPDVVRFDPELTVLAKVEFDKPDEMLFAQAELADDMLGRLLAAQALGKRSTQASVQRLTQLLQHDPFYGVRQEASKSLRKLGSEEAYEALVASLNQSDARVRRQVVSDVTSFYRPETLTQVLAIIESEANPEIQAVAIRALGKFRDKQAQQMIIASLSRPSFRNTVADAAVDAIAAQMHPKFRKPLVNLLQGDTGQFTSSGLADALVTLAKISRDVKDKTNLRSVFEPFLHDARPPVQRGAIRALGELGDPAAIALLQPFSQQTGDDRMARVARDALDRIRDTAPGVPREVVELRKQVADLQEENRSLRKDFESLKEQVLAIRQESSGTSTPQPEAESSKGVVVSEP